MKQKFVIQRHDNLFLLDIDETGQPTWTEDLQKAFLLDTRGLLYERMKKAIVVTMEKKEEIYSFIQVDVIKKQ